MEGVYLPRNNKYAPLVCVHLPRMDSLFVRAAFTWPTSVFGRFPQQFRVETPSMPYERIPELYTIHQDPGSPSTTKPPDLQYPEEEQAQTTHTSETTSGWELTDPEADEPNTTTAVSDWGYINALTEWTSISPPNDDDPASSTIVMPPETPRLSEEEEIKGESATFNPPLLQPLSDAAQEFIRKFTSLDTDSTDISSTDVSSDDDDDLANNSLLQPLPRLELPLMNFTNLTVQEAISAMPPSSQLNPAATDIPTPVAFRTRADSPMVATALNRLRPLFSLFASSMVTAELPPVAEQEHDEQEFEIDSDSDSMPGLQGFSDSSAESSPTPEPENLNKMDEAEESEKEEETKKTVSPLHHPLLHDIKFYIPGFVQPPPSETHDEDRWGSTDVQDYHPLTI